MLIMGRLIRDILKLQSGTHSGTGISSPETPWNWTFLMRGERK